MKKILIGITFLLLLFSHQIFINADVYKIDDYKYYEESYVKYVDAGEYSAAALTTDDQVFTWGKNTYGQLGNGTTVNLGAPQNITENFTLAEGETIEKVSVGSSHNLAYTNENRVFGWGLNSSGKVGDGTTTQRNTPVDITANFSLGVGENVIDVAAGTDASFVITDQGRVFSWGSNSFGQLGNDQTSWDSVVTDQTDHFILQGGEILVSIDVKGRGYMALTDHGRLYAWGRNLQGELGTGTVGQKNVATEITPNFSLDVGEEISAFAIGQNHGIVATNLGDVYTFGDNSFGQIGDGTSVDRFGPTQIASQFSFTEGEYVVYVDAYDHNVITTNYGRVFGWGSNGTKQITGSLASPIRYPYEITPNLSYSEGEKTIQTVTSLFNTFLVTDEDVLYSWGSNSEGMLAQGTITSDKIGNPIKTDGSLSKIEIKSLLYSNVSMVSSFSTHTLLYTETNRLYAWGNNIYGQIGNGTTTRQKTPSDITEHLNLHPNEIITKIQTGRDHSVILTDEFRVIGWGFNSSGNLGIGNSVNQLSPVDLTPYIPLEPGDFVVDIFVASSSTYYFTNNGKFYATGNNHYGQLGLGDITFRYTPVEVTSLTLAPGETIIDLSSGDKHVMISTSENNVWAIGENGNGQFGNSSTSDSRVPVLVSSTWSILEPGEDIIDIVTGYETSGLLTSLGKVYTWGYNSDGLIGDGTYVGKQAPTEITNQFGLVVDETITQFNMGGFHAFVVSSNNRVFSWGDNGYKQLGDNTQTDRNSAVEVTSTLNISTDTLDYVELGGSVTYLITDELNIYAFGRNNYNEVGRDSNTLSFYPSEKLTSSSGIGDIHFSFTNPLILDIDQYVILDYYFTYDLETLLQSITIDSVEYTLSDIEFDVGKITVKIPNTYSSGQELSFTIEEVKLYDDTTYTVTGPSVLETTITEDVTAPTFDDIDNQLFEVGGVFDGNLQQFMSNLVDDFDEDIDVSFTSSLDIDEPGDYTIEATATDDSTNQTTKSFIIQMVDTTPPVITYIKPLFLEASLIDTYVYESFITVNDNVADKGFTISYSTDITTNMPGLYSITYYATDNEGNEGSLTVEITVIDTTDPLFDMIPLQTIEAGEFTNIDWSTLISNVSDNTIEALALYEHSDNTVYNMPGLYQAVVFLEDPSGNSTSQIINIIVVDTESPTFSLSTEIDRVIESGTSDIDWSMLIIDILDNAIGAVQTTEITDNIMYDMTGTYTVVVAVTDASGNQTTEEVSIDVIDTTPPQIILNGDSTINLEYGEEYTEQNASIIDNENLSINIVIDSSNVDVEEEGIYYVTYNATDASGNEALEVIRTIIVTKTVSLFASLNEGIDSIGIGNEFIDAGVTSFSTYDITTVVSGSVDTLAAGTYVITYTITDENDSEIILKRYVTVYEQEPNVAFILGPAKTTIEINETYVDGSCVAVVNGEFHVCTSTDTIDSSIAGIHMITYTLTLDDEILTYTRYVFVVDDSTPIVLYIEEKKDGDYL